MLFETEAEAQAFIRFNSGDILNVSRKAPVRSYYCQLEVTMDLVPCHPIHLEKLRSLDDW